MLVWGSRSEVGALKGSVQARVVACLLGVGSGLVCRRKVTHGMLALNAQRTVIFHYVHGRAGAFSPGLTPILGAMDTSDVPRNIAIRVQQALVQTPS